MKMKRQTRMRKPRNKNQVSRKKKEHKKCFFNNKQRLEFKTCLKVSTASTCELILFPA